MMKKIACITQIIFTFLLFIVLFLNFETPTHAATTLTCDVKSVEFCKGNCDPPGLVTWQFQIIDSTNGQPYANKSMLVYRTGVVETRTVFASTNSNGYVSGADVALEGALGVSAKVEILGEEICSIQVDKLSTPTPTPVIPPKPGEPNPKPGTNTGGTGTTGTGGSGEFELEADGAFFDGLNPLSPDNHGTVGISDQLNSPGAIVSRLLQFLFPLAGLVLFAMLVWGGFEIVSKAGQGTKGIEAGKNRITAAIVGFLLLFGTYWMAQILETIFGIVIV